MGKDRDKEREFRLRPRKPTARGERQVYASAYKIIMHHARMSGVRRRRVVGFGTATHSRPYSQRQCCKFRNGSGVRREDFVSRTLGGHFEEFVDEPILTPDATPV